MDRPDDPATHPHYVHIGTTKSAAKRLIAGGWPQAHLVFAKGFLNVRLMRAGLDARIPIPGYAELFAQEATHGNERALRRLKKRTSMLLHNPAMMGLIRQGALYLGTYHNSMEKLGNLDVMPFVTTSELSPAEQQVSVRKIMADGVAMFRLRPDATKIEWQQGRVLALDYVKHQEQPRGAPALVGAALITPDAATGLVFQDMSQRGLFKWVLSADGRWLAPATAATRGQGMTFRWMTSLLEY